MSAYSSSHVQRLRDVADFIEKHGLSPAEVTGHGDVNVHADSPRDAAAWKQALGGEFEPDTLGDTHWETQEDSEALNGAEVTIFKNWED